LELLDRSVLQDALTAQTRGLVTELQILDQIDSTNRLALSRAQEGAGCGAVFVAEQQSAGRGRRGRRWVSPFGRNIYCSVLWEFDGGAAALEGLSLAVGVAVARALRAAGVESVGLKWPNDVVWGGRKLAGILLEMAGDAAGRCQVVIGIGINVSMTGSTEAHAIDQPWVDVQTAAGRPISRNQLLAGLLSELLPILPRFEADCFEAVREEWSRLDCLAGQPVTVHLGDRMILGVAGGVSETGALLVDTPQGRQVFHGGEVSLRLQS
jgi:BirA family biotin operon repressor/biotin-[acetyl-CoA-carboxylase] ligase